MTNPVIISPAGNTRFVSGRGPNRTVGRDRPLVSNINTPEWALTRFFDNGSAGTKAEGNADSFDSLAGRTRYSDVRSVSGLQSAECRILAADGEGQFGQWGGEISFPTPVYKGSVIWLEQYVFLPTGFRISTPGNGSLKYIRIRNKDINNVSSGFLDIQFRDDDRTDTAWRYIKEGVPTSWRHFAPSGSIPRNQWLRHTFAIQLDNLNGPAGGNARVRVWQNGTLLVNSDALATLVNATDYTDSYYLFTYWNGAPPQDQSFFVDNIRMEAGAPSYTPSWALDLQGVTPEPTVTPFFEDNFSNGQLNPTNGFTYGNDRGSTPVYSEVVDITNEGLTSTDGATYALRTRYPGQPLGSQGDNGQVNFSFGRSLTELWMEWRFYIPANYIHRDQPSGTSENNKFFVVWGGHYQTGSGIFSQLELERGTGGISRTRPIIRHSGPTSFRPTVAAGTLTNIYTGTDPRITTLISPTGLGADGVNSIVPGTWNTVRFYTRRESTSLAYDGIWRMWLNGVKIHDITGLPIGVAPESGRIREFTQGYLWGASNSNFNEPTYFYTRYIKFYDTDPGWV